MVYNRKPNKFGWSDARRILQSLPDPTLEDTQAYIDCYNLINGRLQYKIGIFSKDLVREFFNTVVKSLLSLLQNSTVYQQVYNKLGTRLADLISIIADALI